MCDIVGFIREEFLARPKYFRPNFNTSLCPLILNNVVPSKGFKIMIQIPVISKDCEKNRVTHRFEARYGMPEFIVVFKAAYPSTNSYKNVPR